MEVKDMARVTVVQVVYNSKRFIEPVFSSIFAQTFQDIRVVAVVSGNDDGGKELLKERFPQVEVIDHGYNIGFAKGHNIVFNHYQSDFFQLVNPDLILEPDYIENMLKAFEDPTVGAATGKLYKMQYLGLKIEDLRQSKVLDTTGVVINKSGRAYDRGQHEADRNQYDGKREVNAVSGAGCMYRASVLESVKMHKSSECRVASVDTKLITHNSQLLTDSEYFDEDFHSYWEDVDLSWRMSSKGWKQVFVPEAIGYHGRGAGSSKGGYKKVWSFIKFHKTISPRIRQLNYQNHIFMYVKNSRWFYPQFFIREFFMLGYILLFEWSTLKIVPQMLKLWPKMWKKRQEIKKLAN